MHAKRVCGLAAILALSLHLVVAHAGGPRFVAGTSYFDPSLTGNSIVWPNGQLAYFVDQGNLSASVSNAAAAAIVAGAAAAWNSVQTAAVSITQGGPLAEDVSGANVLATGAGITVPPDIESNATATPVAVIFDTDGSVIDAFYGLDASDPEDCIDTGALNMVDNLTTSGLIAHALIIVNGRCTGTVMQLKQLQFQITRAFGRVLGLDWSQANNAVLAGKSPPSYQQLEGWPLMRPIDLDCNQLSVQCMPNPLQLRADDVAAISRLYPVTPTNIARFTAKALTSSSTISIQGTVSFRSGQGMQGVNVVARPIIPGVGLTDDRYPTSSVSGFLFTGNRGSPITGTAHAVIQFGSTDPLTEGHYNITGIPLPPGETGADYQVTLEAVDPLYIGSEAVGPYILGSPSPSGTMPSVTVHGLVAGQSVEQDFPISDAADDLEAGAGGSPSDPAAISSAGEWQSRIVTPGKAAWFGIAAQGGRHFTIETQALDQANSEQSENKLRPVLGIWNVLDPISALPVNAAIAPFNGAEPGVSALSVDTIADGELLLGVADQRGDGRPDYAFHGRLLYAGTVTPSRLPLAGGTMTITGSGFRPGMTVSLGSRVNAVIEEITSRTIVAVAPPSSALTGSLDLIVLDPLTNGIAAIAGGISYGDATTDTLSIIAHPPASVPANIETPFTVKVVASDQATPIGGVPVFFSLLSGAARFVGCSLPICSITTAGNGYATIHVAPLSAGWTKIRASLSNGHHLDTEFTATPPVAIAAISPPLFLAPGSNWQWVPQVQAWNGSSPATSTSITWSAQGFAVTIPPRSLTNAQGLAAIRLALGPWNAGDTFILSACLATSRNCVTLPVYTVHPEAEILEQLSGIIQSVPAGQSIAPIFLRLIAPGGQPIVGAPVVLTGSTRAWTPPCPPYQACAPGRLLAPVLILGTTASDGSVSFQPQLISNIPQRLTGVASAGITAAISFDIEIHP